MNIQPINQETVHRICSSQVVLTLAVAVKELVENAVDAGATCVEIKLREYGMKLIEVTDNGNGVKEEDFAGLTLKHHTSKIRKFEDLAHNVHTFGFRGEALSSLCALSRLTVTTRHKDADVATKIQYNHQGQILHRTLCARKIGTTVVLEDLFITLPVRHKEFCRSIKKEFYKMMQILNAYCIISAGVKISCYNTVKDDGQRSLVMSTNGSLNMIENISSVFGSKQSNILKRFVQVRPSSDHLEEFGSKISLESNPPFNVTGYISSCEHGHGRGSLDRQYYYVNERPCDLDKLSRLVNEVYHLYNKLQYPSVFLDIQMERGAADVNVTPDKRKVFLDYEPLLLATIKSSLITLWEPEVSLYNQQNLSEIEAKKHTSTVSAKPKTCEKRSFSEIYSKVKQEKDQKKRLCLQSFVHKLKHDQTMGPSAVDKSSEGKMEKTFTLGSDVTVPDSSLNTAPHDVTGTDSSLNSAPHDVTVTDSSLNTVHDVTVPLSKSCDDEASGPCDLEIADEFISASQSYRLDAPNTRRRQELSVQFSLQSIKDRYRSSTDASAKSLNCPLFRAKITPEQNTDAESELKKSISKSDFSKMEVLGQFNHGFIISRLHGDLFIIDQHATDEKYNFEMLQQHTVIKRQALLIPKPLDLSSTNELLLMDHIDVFHKNGFEFVIDKEAEPTKRVLLKTQPVSKNWSFGKDDIDEILYMLRESPERFFRPSRVRAMFASRACRKSVMIGKPLSVQEMRRIVQHMGEIEQPWNCPHGRPTMRHLVNLELLTEN
ncbi:hypothetical protein EB796_021768 [Bugula neritina]|uniref:PMS2 n=1 Tax=Bugula neritina TaxID=10212 RepID=A0A7J7J3D4_BUGNE|nr:hypothetical protein EB796_021768 [Bugula neritina]